MIEDKFIIVDFCDKSYIKRYINISLTFKCNCNFWVNYSINIICIIIVIIIIVCFIYLLVCSVQGFQFDSSIARDIVKIKKILRGLGISN